MGTSQTGRPQLQRRGWLFAFGILLTVGLGLGFWSAWGHYHRSAARAALEQLRFEDARRHAVWCLKVRPADAAAQLLAAQAARRAGDREDALRHLDACERLEGQTPAVALERALLRAESGDLEGLEASLQSRLAPGSPDALAVREALAQGYLAAGRVPEALRCLDDLLRQYPDHPRALAWRAQAWIRLDPEGDRALADARRAVELRPDSGEARLPLALVLERLGWVDEAATQYAWLHRRGFGGTDAVLGLARCRQDLAELEEAQAVLDAFLAEQPDHLAALVERGRLALRRDERVAAEKYLRRAVSLAPDSQDALRLLCLTLEAQGKSADAARARERLHRLEVFTGKIDRLMGEANAAPHDPGPRYRLGLFLLQHGREEEGLSWLAGALDLDPRYEPARTALAAHYRQTGRGPGGGRR